MNEHGVVGCIGECEQPFHALINLVCIGRLVQDRSVPLIDYQHSIGGEPESSGHAGIVMCAVSQDPLKLQQYGHRQIHMDQISQELHPAVVVGDHPLAPVAGLAARFQHLLGHAPGRRGDFQLARRDGLLDQRIHQVSVPGVGTHYVSGQLDAAAGIPIDLVKHPIQISGIAE